MRSTKKDFDHPAIVVNEYKPTKVTGKEICIISTQLSLSKRAITIEVLTSLDDYLILMVA